MLKLDELSDVEFVCHGSLEYHIPSGAKVLLRA
jgi:hypothetical protein